MSEQKQQQNSYREALRINRYDLVDLWETHCDRFVEWWAAFVEAEKQFNTAEMEYKLTKAENKEELENIVADLDHDIRSVPEDFGIDKVTDAAK